MKLSRDAQNLYQHYTELSFHPASFWISGTSTNFSWYSVIMELQSAGLIEVKTTSRTFGTKWEEGWMITILDPRDIVRKKLETG